MPRLIRNITGLIYLPESGTAYLTKEIEGQVGQGDYFKVFGLEVLQQDFSRVEDAEVLIKPAMFGLNNQHKKRMKTITIDK